MFAPAKNSMRIVMALLLTVFGAQPVTASIGSGKVSFYGSIVEPSCRVALNQRLPVLDCAARGDNSSGVERSIADSQFAYIDSDKRLALFTVTYR